MAKVRDAAYWRQYRIDNREARLAAQRKYREKNRERLRAAYAKYVSDPDVHRRKLEQNRKWRQANPDKGRKYSREHKARNPEKISDYRRAYRKANPEQHRASEAERRALKKGVAASMLCGFSNAYMVTIVQELTTQPCTYCGAEVGAEIDHIVPLVRGGLHHPQNLTPACRRCNTSKHTRLLGEWVGQYPCAPSTMPVFAED